MRRLPDEDDERGSVLVGEERAKREVLAGVVQDVELGKLADGWLGWEMSVCVARGRGRHDDGGDFS